MSENELPVELSVEPSPFSRKTCLILRVGGSQWILARFDSAVTAKAFMACRPCYGLAGVDPGALKAILKEKQR